MREHELLLAKIKRKKKNLAKEKARLDELQLDLFQARSRLEPLMEQWRTAKQEVHQLFASLLTSQRLKRNDRRLVQQLYEDLQESGLIDAAAGPAPDDAQDDDVFAGPQDDDQAPWGAELPPPRTPDSVAAAKRPTNGAGALRDIFRRLAVAIHPDRGQSNEDCDARTEAMKEVTRAYEEGDLARLLELEKALLAAGGMLVAGQDESERRCASLERTNGELRHQLEELGREYWAFRQSEPLSATRQLGLGGRGGGGIASAMMAGLQDDLDHLRQLRDAGRAFMEGKITLDEFLAGPGGDPGDELEMLFDVDVDSKDLGAFFADVLPPRRRRARRPRPRQSQPY